MLTLLGAAGEIIGYDRWLKTHNCKTRTLSLFRQGMHWYDAIPNMRTERLRPLMKAFDQMLCEHWVFRDVLGIL